MCSTAGCYRITAGLLLMIERSTLWRFKLLGAASSLMESQAINTVGAKLSFMLFSNIFLFSSYLSEMVTKKCLMSDSTHGGQNE